MAGEASAADPSTLPAVNNFVRRSRATKNSDGIRWSFLLSGSRFSASAGQVFERPVALTTFSLSTGPPGGLDPLNDYSEGATVAGRLFYIAVARSSLRKDLNQTLNHGKQTTP
jgi:hypothetical protein